VASTATAPQEPGRLHGSGEKIPEANQPNAQLSKPPSVPNAKLRGYVKALKDKMKCPACLRGPTKNKFTHFNSLVSHLLEKGDGNHVAWRAQNAERVVQLRDAVGRVGMTPAEHQLQVAAKEGATRSKEQRKQEQEQATFVKLKAEVKTAVLKLRSADEAARKAAVAQFKAWIPAQISARGGVQSAHIFQRFVETPTLSELRRGGFNAADCIRSGYSFKDVRKAGYTAAELCAHRHQIDLTERSVRALLGPKAVRGSQLKWTAADGYYTWPEVASAGFTVAELAEVLDSLNTAQLRSALESCGLDSQGSKKDLIMRMLQPEPAQSAKRKASELALHHEEQMQDVQAAGLADEVAGLRARLEEETQARQRAESAQEEMRAAKRARLEQSNREAAAVAWRDAAGSAAAMEMEVIDSDGFMARFLAFRQVGSCHLHVPGPLLAALPRRVRACGCPLLPRLHPPRRACVQYVEFMLEVLPTKTAKTKLCRLSVRREKLCSDVIGHFGFHEGQCRAFPKQKLFQRTSVVFVDANGDEEEGNDQGGLTVEMYSSFFREVLLRDLCLFEGIADSAGGGSSIGLLPKPDAPAAALEAVGRAICK
jgi:hypothetical protein